MTSKPGQIWRCNDNEGEMYIIACDKYDRVIGEVWLSNGELTDSRGHSAGKPDKDQEFVADSTAVLINSAKELGLYINSGILKVHRPRNTPP